MEVAEEHSPEKKLVVHHTTAILPLMVTCFPVIYQWPQMALECEGACKALMSQIAEKLSGYSPQSIICVLDIEQ